jgi:MerR family transcriptional regulator, heat shock protein HspR
MIPNNEIEIRYTIEQTAEIVGVHKSTLRYWGKIFDIKTPRSEGGQRRYPRDQVDLLKQIKVLFDRHLTTKGVRINLSKALTQT